MADRPLLLTFPMPPNLANARMHWRTKHEIHKQWKAEAVIREPALRLTRHGRPITPYRRLLVSATLYVHQRMDYGNAVARLKWPEDLIVDCGYVVDDGPDHFEYDGMPTQVIDRAHQRVEITILEAA